MMNKGLLSILSAIAGAAVGAVVGAGKVEREREQDIIKAWENSDKNLALRQMMNQWVRIKQEGKSLSVYFEKKRYKRIAVYGMGYEGEALINELKGSEVQTAYGIDRNAEKIFADVDVFTINDELPTVDAIVVTTITCFDVIMQKLKDKVDCPIISLEDILYEI